MKYINSTYFALGTACLMVFGIMTMAPATTHAFDFECLIIPFECDKDEGPRNVTRNETTTYTNSNNVNSNINSPGAVVASGGYNDGTPVYNYDYDYDYNDDYRDRELRITCYPMPLTAEEGETVRWVANAYGGNGSSYHYSWSGTNGLSGSGSAVSKRYNTSGYKNATVRVTSGSRTESHNCDATVYIEEDDRDYPDYPHYPDYPQYPQYPNYPQYYPITVSCTVNPGFIQTGGTATWTAYATGGNGYFTYSWSGSENLYGSGQSVYGRYYTPGTKHATVTVYSGGQSVTRSCGNVLTVGAVYQPPVYPPIYPPYNQGNLDITCYADPSSVRVNQPTTWTATVTGGYGPYTYSWSGTDNLTGNQNTAIKYYATPGSKYALISITSADGRTTSRACSHAVTVRSNTVAKPAVPVYVPPPPVQPDVSYSAASIFSLQNVPWGWVAILVILILFATVLYLMFNRQKI